MIGNALMKVVYQLIKGEKTIADIDMIYYCYDINRTDTLINDLTTDLTMEFIKNQHDLTPDKVNDTEELRKFIEYQEQYEKPIEFSIKLMVSTIISQLQALGKISMQPYHLSEGETVDAIIVGHENITSETMTCSDSNSMFDKRFLFKINDKYYYIQSPLYCQHNFWCKDPIEFIARQLYCSVETMKLWALQFADNFRKEHQEDGAKEPYDFHYAGTLKLLFPEYSDSISQLCEQIRDLYFNPIDGKKFYTFEEIEDILRRLVQEHSASEVGEGLKDIPESAVNAANTVVNPENRSTDEIIQGDS